MTIDRPFTEPIDVEVVDSAADAARLRSRVDAVARGGARAAVLGANDGLVTNVCLILAVAGAGASASEVRVAGFASLVAGAFSMAAGEWVSVRSQVELYEGILGELRLAFVCALLVLAGERRGFGSLAAPLGKQPHALVRQAKLLGLAIVVRGGELGAFLARGASAESTTNTTPWTSAKYCGHTPRMRAPPPKS
jgi:hypothetical protein